MSDLRKLKFREWRGAFLAGTFAILLLLSGSLSLAKISRDREADRIRTEQAAKADRIRTEIAAAHSLVSNCQQIETIKKQIRESVSLSLNRLPKVTYYRNHPVELAQAIKDTENTLRHFGAKDCYALPSVKIAGIKKPPTER